jgi:IS30 family transposase
MRSTNKPLRDAITRLYKQGISIATISRDLGVNRITVWRHLKQANIPLRGHATRSLNYWRFDAVNRCKGKRLPNRWGM